MTSQPWTIYIKETNYGYISFDTEEDAKAWLDDPNDDGVKWNDSKAQIFMEEREKATNLNTTIIYAD